MLQPGTVLDNKYRIEATIGRGGFGYVYRTHEKLTDEIVAIKELVPHLVHNPQMVQRFIQEARATLRLTHPNIARTFSIFQDGETYYLAMEYLPGGSLADRLQRGPQPVEESLRIMNDLCAALDYAHRQGTVHCDIKPANVLFDSRGRGHLADFGVAHVSDQLMTRQVHTGTGMVLGTVRYMAPEQLEGVRDDPRIDIYALGALLYEMLAGRPYLDFETETTPAAQMRNMRRTQEQPPRPLLAMNPDVPGWLAQVVEQALSKSPEVRFASARALQKALRRPLLPRHRPALASERTEMKETARPADSMLQLVLSDGRPVALEAGSLTLGRDSGCDVVVRDSQVSRRLAEVRTGSGGAVVQDLGSTNGTFVNGERLASGSTHRLREGDVLRLGKEATLTIEVGGLRAATLPLESQAQESGRVAPPTRLAPTPERQRQGRLVGWQWAILVGLALVTIAVLIALASFVADIDNRPPASSTAPLVAVGSMQTPTEAPNPVPSATRPPAPAATEGQSIYESTLVVASSAATGDPVWQIVEDAVWRYADAKVLAVGPSHDESQLPTILRGKALQEQRTAVKWQRENGAYYDITLHWMRIEWVQKIDRSHLRALVTKNETLLYYPRDWTTPSTKKSCRSCEYQVVYALEQTGARWYISEKDVEE